VSLSVAFQVEHLRQYTWPNLVACGSQKKEELLG